MTDRTYYRALPTVLLIEQARHSGDELTIALGERLEEYDCDAETIADLLEDNKNLDRRIDALRAELNGLYAQLEMN